VLLLTENGPVYSQESQVGGFPFVEYRILTSSGLTPLLSEIETVTDGASDVGGFHGAMLGAANLFA
jgi:hypothetical protein